MTGTDATMGELDWMGAEGGRLAAAFATGCIACWTFLMKFFWSGIRSSYETRIKVLERDNERCEQRQLQLETLLMMHGPPQLRADMQGVVSEMHLEMRRLIEMQRQEAKP